MPFDPYTPEDTDPAAPCPPEVAAAEAAIRRRWAATVAATRPDCWCTPAERRLGHAPSCPRHIPSDPWTAEPEPCETCGYTFHGHDCPRLLRCKGCGQPATAEQHQNVRGVGDCWVPVCDRHANPIAATRRLV